MNASQLRCREGSNLCRSIGIPTTLISKLYGYICKCLVAIAFAKGEEKHQVETCTLKKFHNPWKPPRTH